MAVVETVKIVSKTAKQGYVIINKSDFTNRDEIFKEKVVEVVEKEEVVEVVEKEEVTEKVGVTNSKRKREGKKDE